MLVSIARRGNAGYSMALRSQNRTDHLLPFGNDRAPKTASGASYSLRRCIWAQCTQRDIQKVVRAQLHETGQNQR